MDVDAVHTHDHRARLVLHCQVMLAQGHSVGEVLAVAEGDTVKVKPACQGTA